MLGTTNHGPRGPLQPTDLVALPRLSHAARCSCFICTADLAIEDYRADLDRADSEEQSDTDEEIDFVRAIAWKEAA